MADSVMELLGKAKYDTKPPSPLPLGIYEFRVNGVPELVDTAKGNHEIYKMNFTPVRMVQTLDEAAYNSWASEYSLEDVVLFLRNPLMVRKDSSNKHGQEQDVAQVAAFARACGMKARDSSVHEFMSGKANGATFQGEVVHEVDDRDGSINARIGSYAAG